MERRDFLKCLFATALAPASAVKELYRPRLSDRDIADVITATLHELPRGQIQNLFEQHAKAIEEFHKALFVSGIIKMKPELIYEGPINFICKNKRYSGVINFNNTKGERNVNK